MIETPNLYPMNLLVTLDRNYVPQLNVMLFSALQSDPAAFFDVYILHDEGLSASDLTATRALLGQRGTLRLIHVDESGLTDAPTSDRYPKAIYYRIFAAKYLPHTLDRVLYLDPDLVVQKLFTLHRFNGDGMTLDDVRQRSAVIHYCGRNKPWKPGYVGELDVFYNEIVSQMEKDLP